MNKTLPIQQFRQQVYHSLPRRADALMNLLDALTVAGHVDSPVALSEQGLFQRKFESVYDGLENGQVPPEVLMGVLTAHLPADSETIAGYAIYALDTTPNPRPDAETLPDRQHLKGQAGPSGLQVLVAGAAGPVSDELGGPLEHPAGEQ